MSFLEEAVIKQIEFMTGSKNDSNVSVTVEPAGDVKYAQTAFNTLYANSSVPASYLCPYAKVIMSISDYIPICIPGGVMYKSKEKFEWVHDYFIKDLASDSLANVLAQIAILPAECKMNDIPPCEEDNLQAALDLDLRSGITLIAYKYLMTESIGYLELLEKECVARKVCPEVRWVLFGEPTLFYRDFVVSVEPL